jgi:hypothetical protein
VLELAKKNHRGKICAMNQLDAERRLSGPELSTLAERLVNASNPAAASSIRETIVRGFYGPRPDA